MINIIDVAVVILILLYFVKHVGGPVRILKNIVIVLLMLVLFGIVAQFTLTLPVAAAVEDNIRSSYFVSFSSYLIRLIYPTIENGAPKVDHFIKEKIIAGPTPEVTVPNITLPKNLSPTIPQSIQ